MNAIELVSDILNPRKVRDAVCQVLNRYWPDAEVITCVIFFPTEPKIFMSASILKQSELLDTISTGVHGGTED